MSREQRAEVVARKSKSSKNNENTENSEENVPTSEDDTDAQAPGESTGDAPVVIDAEAEDVTPPEASEDVSAEDVQPEEIETEAENATEEDTDTPGDTADAEETTSETAPEPETSADASEPESETKSGASIAALVVGGIVAGAVGFFGASLAPAPPMPEFDTSALDAGITANADAVAALVEEVAAFEATPVTDLSVVEDQLASITQSLDTITTRLASVETALSETTEDLGAKVTALDDRILLLETAAPSANASSSGELAALRERIAEMTAAAEEQLAAAQLDAASVARAAEEARLAAEAEAAELRAAAEAKEAELQAAAERQAAFIDLKSAIEAGAPFAEFLGVLDPVPEVLATHAEAGVPTILALQESFPDAARAALAQSDLVEEGASAGERFSAFLRSRTNARSLTPQDGDGPDAVLSRAEASLGGGDLRGALSELDALGDSGKAAMSGWMDQANTRLSAIAAIDQLSATN